MSVTTLPLIDKAHFNFSHHVEHHLFPRMSAASAPAVRAWLQENTPDRYVSPAHHVALTALYRTPRVYLDATTLCDPEDVAHHVSTGEIETTLRRRRDYGARYACDWIQLDDVGGDLVAVRLVQELVAGTFVERDVDVDAGGRERVGERGRVGSHRRGRVVIAGDDEDRDTRWMPAGREPERPRRRGR